jgi:hypothetical protein
MKLASIIEGKDRIGNPEVSSELREKASMGAFSIFKALKECAMFLFLKDLGVV